MAKQGKEERQGDEMSKWQKIETAPKDAAHKKPVSVLLWCRELKEAHKGILIGADAAFVSLSGYVATHWMPLPEPPKEEAH